MTTRPAARTANERQTAVPSERPLPDVARTMLVDVLVNGERRTTSAPTLAALLAEAGYAGAKIATAINGDFVPERTRAQTQLLNGDQIEIVAPRQGG